VSEEKLITISKKVFLEAFQISLNFFNIEKEENPNLEFRDFLYDNLVIESEIENTKRANNER
jgi:hypothetical protein